MSNPDVKVDDGTGQTRTELLTSADAAKVADVTPATIRTWTASGALPSMSTPSGQRIIRRADLIAYIETREQS
jgi:DNA-binding transcriptional MerR regulator